MYYVVLDLQMPDGSMCHLGSSQTDDFDKVTSQFKAFRDVSELFVCSGFAVSYDLKLGTLPSSAL